MIITHSKVSAAAAASDPDLVDGPDWNADHVITGASVLFSGFLDWDSGTSELTVLGLPGATTRIGYGEYRMLVTGEYTQLHMILSAVNTDATFGDYLTRTVIDIPYAGTTRIMLYVVEPDLDPIDPGRLYVTAVQY
jgi:hypothetical protein